MITAKCSLVATQAADVAVSTDCLDLDEDRSDNGCKSGAYNTGLILFRPTSVSDSFLAEYAPPQMKEQRVIVYA